ncbi:MAG: hypothetical protein JNJ59_16640, partial [Deltaproteobacteria bacterium]|nr:hypothetical protein [Deltaproteobacteria bacterium]
MRHIAVFLILAWAPSWVGCPAKDAADTDVAPDTTADTDQDVADTASPTDGTVASDGTVTTDTDQDVADTASPTDGTVASDGTVTTDTDGDTAEDTRDGDTAAATTDSGPTTEVIEPGPCPAPDKAVVPIGGYANRAMRGVDFRCRNLSG